MNEHLAIRPLELNDISSITRYWTDSPPSFLQEMGVDLSKLPTYEQMNTMLQGQLALPIEQRRSNCVIWEHNGHAIGHSNTNPTTFGENAFMHLHLWQPANRVKGMGLTFVKLTLPWFFEQLQLKTLYSEPYALNPAPNKTLEKAGFELQKEYVTIPGSINFEQRVKRWVMTREKYDLLYKIS